MFDVKDVANPIFGQYKKCGQCFTSILTANRKIYVGSSSWMVLNLPRVNALSCTVLALTECKAKARGHGIHHVTKPDNLKTQSYYQSIAGYHSTLHTRGHWNTMSNIISEPNSQGKKRNVSSSYLHGLRTCCVWNFQICHTMAICDILRDYLFTAEKAFDKLSAE